MITEVGNATSTVTPRTFYESERCALVWGYTAETRDCDSKMSCGVWDGGWVILPSLALLIQLGLQTFGYLYKVELVVMLTMISTILLGNR